MVANVGLGFAEIREISGFVKPATFNLQLSTFLKPLAFNVVARTGIEPVFSIFRIFRRTRIKHALRKGFVDVLRS